MATTSPDPVLTEHAVNTDVDLLRFITCGSVDDGKSTLIGRLLYDRNLVCHDHIQEIMQTKSEDGEGTQIPDFSLLLDGLEAEREQGITIDVSYRYFRTAVRKFIVADTPGHEQYTRNMATGASTADLAVILIDASKGVAAQTRRHAIIIALLGIRHVVVAINKMDQVGFSQQVFNSIEEQFRSFAAELGFTTISCIPVSALLGDNVATVSSNMSWYGGADFLSYLETVEIKTNATETGFRMPIQSVIRAGSGFRGYAGTIVAGCVGPDDIVQIMPSGVRTRVKEIITMDGALETAGSGRSIVLSLQDEVDASRGDYICDVERPAQFSNQFQAELIWMSADPLLPGREYFLKTVNKTVSARISNLKYKIDIEDFSHEAANTLCLNEVGVCNLSLGANIVFDPYEENRETGSFILIDKFSARTIAAGMLKFSLRRASNLVWQNMEIQQSDRAGQKSQKPGVVWLTGLSASGKSTIANLLEKKLFERGCHTYILDGDNVRHGLNGDLGFKDEDRVENIRRVGEVARLMTDAGLIVLVSFISPFVSERKMARRLFPENQFVEVFVKTTLAVAEARDPKGLYAKARRGEIANFTGIDSAYEEPKSAEITIDTTELSADEAAEGIMQYLKEHGFLTP
jgi:bifunctional enzyme CysN/CysC